MELVVLDQNSNVIAEAYKSDDGAQSLFDKIAEQARSVVFDVNNSKDRDAIKSLARKVASSKTAFDAHGKKLKEQYTVITSKIDADRKLFRDQCDALRDEIRQPVTDYENAEKQRIADLEVRLSNMGAMGDTDNLTSNQIKARISELESINTIESWAEYQDRARLTQFETLDKLRSALAACEQHEKEQAELEAMRQAEQQRLQKERDDRIALEAKRQAEREAEEKALIEAQRVENEKREAAEKVERERLAAIEREAKIQAEKEAAIQREEQLKLQAIEREKQAEIEKALAAERAEQAAKQAEHDKQMAIQAERDRIEREAAQKAEADRIEQEAREANKAHKKAVCDSILAELSKIGISEDIGKELIKAIHSNQIPNITLTF